MTLFADRERTHSLFMKMTVIISDSVCLLVEDDHDVMTALKQQNNGPITAPFLLFSLL